MKNAEEIIQRYRRISEEIAVSSQKRQLLGQLFEEYEERLDKKIKLKNYSELFYNSDFVGFTITINSKGNLSIDNEYFSEANGYPLDYEQFCKITSQSLLSEFFDRNIRKYLESKGYYVGGIASNRRWVIYFKTL